MDYCIYILSFNHPELTERCVTSCLKFHQNVNLIHNGSLPKAAEKLKTLFPQVTHIEIANNKGFTGGANTAITHFLKHQTSQWFLFVTNDCELLGVHSLPPVNGLYAPLIMKRKTDQVDSLGGGIDLKKLSLFHIKTPQALSPQNYYVPGTSWLMDRESLQKAPQFQVELGTYWEDVLFSFECKKLGIQLGQHSEISLRHGIGKTCHKDPQYTSYLYRRNRWWVLKRVLNLSVKQKMKLIIQDLIFCMSLIFKGQYSKAKLALLAFWQGNFSNQIRQPNL